jgi:hypothetical protein
MKEYLEKLKKLIDKYGKAKVAVSLEVTDTRTIDAWFQRKMIPSKYLDTIKELK